MEVGNSRGASQPDVASGGVGQTAQQMLVEEILQLGRMPVRTRDPFRVEENLLARRLWRARAAGSLTKEQEAALGKLAQANVTKVVQQVRDLGHYPKRNAVCSLAERQLAEKLCRALEAKQFSPEQEAELQALRHASPKQEEELMQQVSARRAEELIQQVRDLGHYSKESRRCTKEKNSLSV